MGLLDELKKQASALKDEERKKNVKAHERASRARVQLVPALQKIRQYLSELVEQLSVLRPDVTVDFPVQGFGTLAGLKQGEYELTSGGDPLQSVTLKYTLRSKHRHEVKVRGLGSLDTWLETIKRQGLEVYSAKLTDGTSTGVRAEVALEGFVPVTLRFKLDTDASTLLLIIRNYDELVDRRHVISPDDVDDDFLEQLGRFILRQENRFLIQDMPTEMRERLRRRLEQDKNKGGGENASVLGSRFKSLFKKRAQLTLRYQDQVRELSTFASGFTLGRGSICDMIVDDRHVSRVHARIEVKDDVFVLTDDSTNGTFVRLQDGRLVRLKKESLPLVGKGMIALGSQPVSDNPHVLEFEA